MSAPAIVRRLGSAAIGISVLLGIKFYDKSSTHDAMRAKLEILCEKDSKCLSAVGKNFDACFDKSYSMGNRHSAGSLKTDAFFACFNKRSGAQLFTANEVVQQQAL
jgi:hypothetical protein